MDQDLEQSLGELLAKIGPLGVIALLIFVWVKTDPKIRKTLRHQLWVWIKWLARKIWYLIVVAWWAARNKIPFRLALRLQPDRWDAMVDKRKLAGLKRGKIKRTPTGVSVRLTLTGRLTTKYVHSQLRQLETGLGLGRDTVRLRQVSRSDRLILEIKIRNPLEGTVPWERPGRKIRFKDPVRLSVTEFGDVVSVSAKNRIGVFGESGSGKSCTQRILGAHAVTAVDAGLEIWDLKQGVEAQQYRGKAYIVTTVPDALVRLEWLLDEEFPRRAAIMKKRGWTEWRETEDDPAQLIIIDEGNVITRGFTAGQFGRMCTAIEQGRALGIFFVWATQYPKAENLPTQIRSQLNITICHKVRNSEEAQIVFKDDVKKGWAPHTLAGEGWVLVQSSKHRDPEESKVAWLSPEIFRGLELVGSVPGRSVTVVDADPADDAPAPEPGKASVADDVWAVLATSSSPLGIRELARRTGRSNAAVHAAVKKLEGSGFVQQTGGGYSIPVKDPEGDEG
jgi:hypothetical protein